LNSDQFSRSNRSRHICLADSPKLRNDHKGRAHGSLERGFNSYARHAAMFHPWRIEDFLPTAAREAVTGDFWEPKQSPLAALPCQPPLDFWETSQFEATYSQNGTHAVDFWDPIPSSESAEIDTFSDWSEGIVLPLYNAHASENPFSLDDAPPSLEGITRRRARWLVSLLDLPTTKARRWFADKFEELFDEFPHHMTFHALSELALDGASEPASEIWTGR
jgi:hypothetical protein